VSRTISASGLQSLFAQETESVWLPAVTVAHTDLPATLRFVANTQDIVYGGNTYLACPFELTIAPDNEESVPQARIRIDNVSQDITVAVRSTDTSPTITLEIFRVDSGGVVTREYGPHSYDLLTVNADALVVEGVVGYEHDFLNEQATADRFVPSLAPGLF
jgi:hypothetical protein